MVSEKIKLRKLKIRLKKLFAEKKVSSFDEMLSEISKYITKYYKRKKI